METLDSKLYEILKLANEQNLDPEWKIKIDYTMYAILSSGEINIIFDTKNLFHSVCPHSDSELSEKFLNLVINGKTLRDEILEIIQEYKDNNYDFDNNFNIAFNLKIINGYYF